MAEIVKSYTEAMRLLNNGEILGVLRHKVVTYYEEDNQGQVWMINEHLKAPIDKTEFYELLQDETVYWFKKEENEELTEDDERLIREPWIRQ